MKKNLIIKVAIPSPLRKLFDYLPPLQDADLVVPGTRVKVSFGRKQLVGFVVQITEHSDFPRHKLKRISTLLDQEPLFSPSLWNLLLWCGSYYHYALGEILARALPKMLRNGEPARLATEMAWRLLPQKEQIESKLLARAPKQNQVYQQLLNLHAEHPEKSLISWHELQSLGVDKRILELLSDKKLVEKIEFEPQINQIKSEIRSAPILNAEQQAACQEMAAALGGFTPFLLDGITGSGKTEVYLHVVEQVVRAGRQALILLPEIGLTPQTLTRFTLRIGAAIGLLHSGLTDKERCTTWLKAKNGDISVLIGTRSAIFADFKDLGVIVVDESHDHSFKQWEGFQYHARDVAVRRAQLANIPVILGSATPALSSLHNAWQGKFNYLTLSVRATGASLPLLQLIDMRQQKAKEGLSKVVVEQVQIEVEQGNQVLFFLNRRGFAPVLLCHDCGWLAECDRCQSPMTLHQQPKQLRCHHCGKQHGIYTACVECGGKQLLQVGMGTQRLEQTLQGLFPKISITRIDRDSTRKKGALEAKLNQVHYGNAQLLVGTQMLAKGHHFPNVTLVVMLDIDGALYSGDFSANEAVAQQVIQVAGRAGRAEKKGAVMIQTHHPDSVLLQTLISQGYNAVAKKILLEREEVGLPPYAHLALFTAEAVQSDSCQQFLQDAHASLQKHAGEVTLLGPLPAPIEKRAGRYRWQLVLSSKQRGFLHRLLNNALDDIEALPLARKVRWSLDIDPIDLL